MKARSISFFKLGDGEGAITEGLRTALARLRQRSASPGSQTSPLHPASPPSHSAVESAPSSSNSPTPRPRMTVSSQSGPRAPEDLISSATTALKRLHFKTGRCATKNTSNKGQAPPVPKVIVMGSSTASETTINTSTDSSNTMITTMTATDGDNTEDSLDLVCDPVSIDYYNSENIMDTPRQPLMQPAHSISPKTPPTVKAHQDTKFCFDQEKLLKIEDSYDQQQTTLSDMDELAAGEKTPKRTPSFKMKRTMNDFDKIEVDRSGNRERSSVSPRGSRKYKKRDQQRDDKYDASPSNPSDTDNPPKPKHRHKKSSSKRRRSPKTDKFIYDEKYIAKYRDNSRQTPPLPDLRVDFFNETLDAGQGDLLLLPISGEKRGSVCLNKCLREVGAVLDAAATSPINVTTNPMDTSVHFVRKPQATIVVQQPSLSLDQSNVSTILLKNGSDFVSTVESAGSGNKLCFKKQREENMKQLLDVTNNLTLEEIHDFEMRYGSPHHSRSQSVKTPGRSSGRPNYLCLPQQRSRVASMPNTGVEEEYYRLRHFSITGKGVVNRGDSLKSRRSRSNNSVASSNSSTEQLTTGHMTAPASAKTSASCSLASSRESSTSCPGPQPYRVVMLGAPAVGKSSLVSQFMTSEYLHAYDTSIDDESGEKSVSVLLAGEESELTFIDHSYTELSPETCIAKYQDPHAYVVVFSSADRSSLGSAERILQTLWKSDSVSTKAVILVANKADLVRSKVVTTEEGKSMATSYDCKYIETSVGINHNVDELLVGILTQIRLKLENPERTRDLFRKRSCSRKNLNRNKSPASGAATPTGSAQNSPKKYRGSRTSASLKVRGLLGKVWARDSKSKSCENLHVL